MEELAEEELVDDRALAKEDQDRFGHKDFAVELANMVTTVKTPANIALFAPWGSGKSGLSNLLRLKLEEKPDWKDGQLRFAHFDAFKFAEAPLRRNFIAEVARQFNIKDDEFHSGLYQDVTTNDLKADKQKLWAAIKYFFVGLGLALAICAAVAGTVSWIGDSSFMEVVDRLIVPLLPVTAVLTTSLAVLVKGFTVTSSRSAPSTAEEFEKTFKNLVDKAKADRLVIFVDELDRCASHEVAETLETIKTFLEVKGCVFVVAADHQVLEQALRKRVRQETPVDPQNPYFSAGSSYLDKVFQFQLSLPRLKQRRLTQFALGLVEERPGLWQRVDRLHDVISVLIPTHVTSPRRVKVLLNSFAINYRLAERRAEQDLLAKDVNRRAPEIAKLVCLRCEFPIFAEELNRDVALVTALQEVGEFTEANEWDKDNPAELAERVAEASELPHALLERAVPYFVGESQVAELLTDDDEDTDEEEQKTKQAHAEQLVRYLLRTRHVQGPLDDLVHLEGSGVGLSLSTAEATELERAAVDGDFRAAESIIETLDDDSRPDAFRLLSQLLGESSLGIEDDNILSVLFKSVERFRDEVQSPLNAVVAAVNQHHYDDGIKEDCLPGALLLARMRGGNDGARLRSRVLKTDGALEDPQVCVELIEDAEELLPGQNTFLATAITRVLLEQPQVLQDHLDRISKESLLKALRVGRDEVRSRYHAHYDASEKLHDEGVEDEEEKSELESVELDDDPASSMGKALSSLAVSKRYPEAEAVMRLMLFVDHSAARNAVEDHLDQITPLESPDSIDSILVATEKRKTPRWPTWLGAIDPEHELTDTEVSSFKALVEKHWIRSIDDAPPAPEELAAATVSLSNLGELGSDPIADRLSEVDLTRVGDEGQQKKRAQVIDTAIELANANLTDHSAVTDSILRSSIEVLQTDQSFSDPMVTDLSAEHRAASSHFAKYAIKGLETADSDLIEEFRAVVESPPDWLTENLKAKLKLKTSLAAARHDGHAPDPGWIADVVSEQGTAVITEIAEWLGQVKPPPNDARQVLTFYSRAKPGPILAGAMRSYSDTLGPVGKYELVAKLLEAEPASEASVDFLAACGLNDADEEKVAKQLIRAFEEAKNDEQRRRILRLWEIFSPTKQAVRWDLVEKIWLPLLRGNQSKYRAAIDHFSLIVPAPSRRKKVLVEEIMKVEIKDSALRKRLYKNMREQKWIKKKGPFGLGGDTAVKDYGDENG